MDTPNGPNNYPHVGVQLVNLRKTFKTASGMSVAACDDVTLDIPKGQLFVLLGPSGGGKTTLLRLIAGLETPDSGRIVIGDTVVYDSERKIKVSPYHRPIGMVFQGYALWPNMTALENISYPLKNIGFKKDEINKRAVEVLRLVGVEHAANSYPNELSGGQQQRVAVGRALASSANTMLLDEPLSNVDARLRMTLRAEIVKMQRELGFTGIYVTHDQDEAMSIGAMIGVISNGRVQQIGTPAEIYDHPKNYFMASFIGRMNELEGSVLERKGAHILVATPVGTLKVEGETWHPGDKVVLMSRPEAWDIQPLNQPEARQAGDTSLTDINIVKGQLKSCSYLGTHSELIVACGNESLIHLWVPTRVHLDYDAEVAIRISPKNFKTFVREGT